MQCESSRLTPRLRRRRREKGGGGGSPSHTQLCCLGELNAQDTHKHIHTLVQCDPHTVHLYGNPGLDKRQTFLDSWSLAGEGMWGVGVHALYGQLK